MARYVRRVTANLPAELLQKAMDYTGKGITETLVDGLELLRRRRFYEKFKALQGKVHLEIDIDESRGRNRR